MEFIPRLIRRRIIFMLQSVILVKIRDTNGYALFSFMRCVIISMDNIVICIITRSYG